VKGGNATVKILLIDGAPTYGGQAKNVYNLALDLKARGHDVAVTCNHEQLYAALHGADIEANY
jgi:glycogen synthase